jgi:hypothetical protein
MARKASRRPQSSASAKTGRRDNGLHSSNPFYGDILGIAGSLLRNRQAAGAEKIGSLADAARNFAHNLTDIPNIQTYATAAAEQMENLSDYVTDSSLEQMVDDATGFAKRYPVATAVFAVAVGFGFTRLMTHNAGDHREAPRKSGPRTARRGAVKSTSSKKRATSSLKPRANGRDTSHERANAS